MNNKEYYKIKKNKTPKGDGNSSNFISIDLLLYKIKKNKTPKGDGNNSD